MLPIPLRPEGKNGGQYNDIASSLMVRATLDIGWIYPFGKRSAMRGSAVLGV
jgi:hypothetical protein